MIAATRHTQIITKFYQGIRQDPEKSGPFQAELRDIISRAGREFNAEEVGRALAVGLVMSLSPAMDGVPGVVQEMLSHVFLHEVDWKHVASQFVTDETLN